LRFVVFVVRVASVSGLRVVGAPHWDAYWRRAMGLIEDCWEVEPMHRPDAQSLLQRLEEMLE
jgi:hypothetical protein